MKNVPSACTSATSKRKLKKKRKVAVPETVQYYLQRPVYRATRKNSCEDEGAFLEAGGGVVTSQSLQAKADIITCKNLSGKR